MYCMSLVTGDVVLSEGSDLDFQEKKSLLFLNSYLLNGFLEPERTKTHNFKSMFKYFGAKSYSVCFMDLTLIGSVFSYI